MNSGKESLNIYARMLLIRMFEETILELFQKGALKGTTHPYIGEEAVAVGVTSEMKSDDYVVSTHRGHGHFLAKGGDVNKLMAEIFGKAGGICGGRGGSQNIIDLDIGFLGSNGITGGGLPIAVGAGYSIKYRRTKQIAACFFGDGAANQGTFHESLNMASLWMLPVLFVCENNYYAMSTPICASNATGNIAGRGAAYNIKSYKMDGNDVIGIKKDLKRIIQKMRKNQEPVLIEMETYRHKGHSKSDVCSYRTKEEENAWLKRCPIEIMGKYLTKNKMIAKSALDSAREKIKRQVNKAVELAMAGEIPKKHI